METLTESLCPAPGEGGELQNFSLSGGQSCQILANDGGPETRVKAVYRIALSSGDSEIKIIREGLPPIVIGPRQPLRAVDVVATGNIYLEVLGRAGNVTGTYDCVGVSG